MRTGKVLNLFIQHSFNLLWNLSFFTLRRPVEGGWGFQSLKAINHYRTLSSPFPPSGWGKKKNIFHWKVWWKVREAPGESASKHAGVLFPLISPVDRSSESFQSFHRAFTCKFEANFRTSNRANLHSKYWQCDTGGKQCFQVGSKSSCRYNERILSAKTQSNWVKC